jgi:hypothetical protein
MSFDHFHRSQGWVRECHCLGTTMVAREGQSELHWAEGKARELLFVCVSCAVVDPINFVTSVSLLQWWAAEFSCYPERGH